MTVFSLGPERAFAAGRLGARVLLGRRIGILRADDGAWSGMDLVCRHQNADLSLGAMEGSIVTCPRHGWRYDLATGDCLTEPWAKLRRYRVWVEDGRVWIDLRPLDSEAPTVD